MVTTLYTSIVEGQGINAGAGVTADDAADATELPIAFLATTVKV